MESKNNEKKVLALSFLGVLTFIAVVVGATYAYFTAQGGGTGNINVNAGTATTDNLSFQTGSAISLTANQEDFGQGSGNKSGETFARATLTANNATNNATRNYYVYLDITSNNFEYTTVDEQAELLLKVTDPDGTEVTTLGSLERKTSGSGANQVTGFDITTQTGLITIADNYEITSTGTVTQEWQIEVIFANLDSDQNANTGKTFSANLIIQEEPMEDEGLAYHETCTPGTMACDIARTYNETNPEINGLYYHDADLANGAQDNSYRYSGANPNNYVCFGATGADCQNENNQYRIIGVFNNQVKLIKATSYGDYAWASSGVNTWDETTKPDIYTTLNETYYNTLGSEWQNLIAESTWQVGGMDYSNTNTAKQYYDVEVGTGQSGYEETMKIGLMYVSDYGFGANPEKWTTALVYPDGENYGTDNWLYLGAYEWLISRDAGSSGYAFYVSSFHGGGVTGGSLNNTNAVRPSFSLASTVEISSGTGTSTDPFVLNLG